MPSATTTPEYLNMVRKSGLLDPAALARVADETDLPDEPQACAEWFVRAGLLTPFQAKSLLAGKHRGMVLGPYRILKPLGRGGMGAVYLGEHSELHRRVAIKVLVGKGAREPVALERLFREARAVAALDHPNIVRLYDVCQNEGARFLVMEHVDGTDLNALLARDGAQPIARATGYISQAAAGLGHAHGRGFVHRDIKPANLILAKDGTVKLLDLGLARSLDNPQDRLTTLFNAPITGTADYSSPEQATGGDVDPRSDIYSLGATLFYLITGRPPFKGSQTQILMQHQMADPPQVSKALRVAVPPSLNDVIAKMMAKKKAERYQSAEEVIDALAPWLPAPLGGGSVQDDKLSTRELREAGVPTHSTRQSTKKTRRAKKRAAERAERRKWYAIGGAAALLLVVGLVAALAGGGKKPADNAPLQLPPGGPGAPAPADESQLLVTSIEAFNDIALSADGKRFAAVDWAGGVTFGTTADPRRAKSITVQGGQRLLTVVGVPGGRQFVAAGANGPMRVLDWESGQVAREFPGHTDTTWGLALSRDGKYLASCGNDGAVVLRDFASGDVVRVHEFESKLGWSVAFSPDSTKLAATCSATTGTPDSAQVRVWDVAGGQELHRFTGHTRDVRSAAFSPDGQLIASAGFDGTVRIWDLKANSQVRALNSNGGQYCERVAFTANGKRLVACGGFAQPPVDGSAGLRVWDVATGQEVQSWRGPDARGMLALALSPDGSFALTGHREKTLRLWKLPR